MYYSQFVFEGTTYTVAGMIGHRGKPNGQKRYSCYACHQDFDASKVMFFRGRPYGIPCGCSKDINQLKSKGD
jgi:hypothetical protein